MLRLPKKLVVHIGGLIDNGLLERTLRDDHKIPAEVRGLSFSDEKGEQNLDASLIEERHARADCVTMCFDNLEQAKPFIKALHDKARENRLVPPPTILVVSSARKSLALTTSFIEFQKRFPGLKAFHVDEAGNLHTFFASKISECLKPKSPSA